MGDESPQRGSMKRSVQPVYYELNLSRFKSEWVNKMHIVKHSGVEVIFMLVVI